MCPEDDHLRGFVSRRISLEIACIHPEGNPFGVFHRGVEFGDGEERAEWYTPFATGVDATEISFIDTADNAALRSFNLGSLHPMERLAGFHDSFTAICLESFLACAG